VTRHPADLFSLVTGLLALGAGLVLLTGGLGDVPMEWVGPLVAIGLGVVIVFGARPRREPTGDRVPPTREA